MTINTFLEDNVKEIPDAFQPPIESKSWKWIDISISRFCTPFICRGRHFIIISSTKSKDLTTAEITKICTLDHINFKYFHDNTNFYLFQKKKHRYVMGGNEQWVICGHYYAKRKNVRNGWNILLSELGQCVFIAITEKV